MNPPPVRIATSVASALAAVATLLIAFLLAEAGDRPATLQSSDRAPAADR